MTTPRRPSPRPPAIAHAKVPVAQSTAGKQYRVRDRHIDLGGGEQMCGTVWGENLTYADATKLKDQVVGSKKSRTARVEEMSVALPGQEDDLAPALPGDADLADVGAAPVASVASVASFADPLADLVVDQDEPIDGYEFDLAEGEVELEIPGAGVVVAVPDGHELVVNGFTQAVPSPVKAGDKVKAKLVDPQLAAARAKALGAARAAAAAPGKRPAYFDRTVKPQEPRRGPAPKDKTVPKAPRVVRLGAPQVAKPQPPPSPLKVATIADGDPLDDNAITDGDIPDLDIGGAPSALDHWHAEQARDQQKPSGT